MQHTIKSIAEKCEQIERAVKANVKLATMRDAAQNAAPILTRRQVQNMIDREIAKAMKQESAPATTLANRGPNSIWNAISKAIRSVKTMLASIAARMNRGRQP